MEGFVQYGSWILIDPDERHIDLIEETIDLENLCDLLRCDSTDLLNLGDSYLGFVDGEGAWQERQTEWEFDGKSCWGPMLIFIMTRGGVCPGNRLARSTRAVSYTHLTLPTMMSV